MIEYKEVITKKGNRIVFCKFEDLLTQFYNVKSIQEVEAMNNDGQKEYIIHCPFCKEEGHSKHKLYVKKDLTVGYCFVCCRTFMNVSDEIDTTVNLENPVWDRYNNNKEFKVIKLDDPNSEWNIDKFEYECDDFDQRGYNYLLSRHKYLAELYKTLDFKFLDGNVVMPFKYKGEVFYYQIRFSSPGSKIRYFFPPISAKPPYIIEHGRNKKFIIVEGVYDAIAALIMAPEYTPFAVLGSNISDYQLQFLREYIPEKILVMMDEFSISKRIADKIKKNICYCPVNIYPTSGADPEEIMKELMKKHKEVGFIHD